MAALDFVTAHRGVVQGSYSSADRSLDIRIPKRLIPARLVVPRGLRILLQPATPSAQYLTVRLDSSLPTTETDSTGAEHWLWRVVEVTPDLSSSGTGGEAVEFPPYVEHVRDATLDVGPTSTAQLDVSTLFSVVGGSVSGLRYALVPSHATAFTSSLSGSTLNVTGVTPDRTSSVTVTATDATGVVARAQVTVVVLPAARPPVVTSPLGDISVTVGETSTRDLSRHFADPDGDTLSFNAVSSDSTVARVTLSGSTLSVVGVAAGTATVGVTASAGTPSLSVSSSAQVTVTPSAAPHVTTAIGPIVFEATSPARVLPVADYFADRNLDTLDGAAYWGGIPGRPAWEREIWQYWEIRNGSIVLRSRIPRPGPPWGTGTPWAIPVGMTYRVWVSSTGFYTRTVVGSPTSAWIGGDIGVVEAVLPPDRPYPTPIPAQGAMAHAGPHIPDAVRIEYDSSTRAWSLSPGTEYGTHAILRLQAYDAAAHPVLSAAQDVTVSLSTRPVTVGTIPQRSIVAGAPTSFDVAQYFRAPDNSTLSYRVAGTDPAGVVRGSASGSQVTVLGVAAGSARIDVRAANPAGLEAQQWAVVLVSARPHRAPAPWGYSRRVEYGEHLLDTVGSPAVIHESLETFQAIDPGPDVPDPPPAPIPLPDVSGEPAQVGRGWSVASRRAPGYVPADPPDEWYNVIWLSNSVANADVADAWVPSVGWSFVLELYDVTTRRQYFPRRYIRYFVTSIREVTRRQSFRSTSITYEVRTRAWAMGRDPRLPTAANIWDLDTWDNGAPRGAGIPAPVAWRTPPQVSADYGTSHRAVALRSAAAAVGGWLNSVLVIEGGSWIVSSVRALISEYGQSDDIVELDLSPIPDVETTSS